MDGGERAYLLDGQETNIEVYLADRTDASLTAYGTTDIEGQWELDNSIRLLHLPSEVDW